MEQSRMVQPRSARDLKTNSKSITDSLSKHKSSFSANLQHSEQKGWEGEAKKQCCWSQLITPHPTPHHSGKSCFRQNIFQVSVCQTSYEAREWSFYPFSAHFKKISPFAHCLKMCSSFHQKRNSDWRWSKRRCIISNLFFVLKWGPPWWRVWNLMVFIFPSSPKHSIFLG